MYDTRGTVGRYKTYHTTARVCTTSEDTAGQIR